MTVKAPVITDIILDAVGVARQDGLLVATGLWGVCPGTDGRWHAIEHLVSGAVVAEPRIARVYASAITAELELDAASAEKLAEYTAELDDAGHGRAMGAIIAASQHPVCPLGAVLRGREVELAAAPPETSWTLRPFVQRALGVSEAWVYGFLAAMDDPESVGVHERAWVAGNARSWEAQGRRVVRGEDNMRHAMKELRAGIGAAGLVAHLGGIKPVSIVKEIR